MQNQKIVPHLWFDKEAKEAAGFYATLFSAHGESSVDNVTTLHDTPSGDCDIVSFTLAGQKFMAISAGPYFKINPSISFFVNFDPSRNPKAEEDLNALWAGLSAGGKALMPLDKYPFSQRYGWIQDKYGVSWQLMLTDPSGEPRPFIVPSLMFTQSVASKAEEATDFYLSVFKNSKRGALARYPAGMAPDKEGTLMFTDFILEGQWFAAMDSAHAHEFIFTEAVSLIVNCEDQKEIDYYWEKLSAVPESEQCGWLKDKYGVSWQITSRAMDEMMKNGDQAKINRLTQSLLKMKKIDIAELEKAAEGK